ncbi:LPS export ABC transporter periplasmic protein LptC, partial [bacterium]|nr:LPS export ABC transporter periplasmic protein LptC [bacterium]
MKFSKGLVIGILFFLSIITLIALSYLIPVVFLKLATSLKTPVAENSEEANTTIDIPPTSVEGDGPSLLIKPFKRLVTSQGKPELEIRASEAKIDQVKRLFILNQIEEIRFYGKANEHIVVKADRGVWNQENNRIEISGNVTCNIIKPEEDTINVTCQWLKYDNISETLTCGSEVNITRTFYRAVGNKLIIRPNINHIELNGEVTTTIEIEAFEGETVELEEPVTITADNLFYNGEAKLMQFNGKPVVTSGRNVIRCNQIQVDLKNKNTRIVFKDNCEIQLAFPGKEGVFSSETAYISAREVLLDMVAGELRMMDNITFVHGTRKLNATKRVS